MKKSGFMEGALIATFAIFFTKFLGIIYAIPFKNIVGDQGGALYGYAYNIYALFLNISTAGIPLALSKLTSEYNVLKMFKEKEYMFQITRKIIITFSIICFLICFLGAPVITDVLAGDVLLNNSKADIIFVIRCVSFAILIVPMLAISRGYLQGHGYISPASFSQVIEQIVRIIVILGGSYCVLNILKLDLKTAIGVAVFGACAGAIASYVYLINKLIKVKNKEKLNTNELKKEEKNNIIKKIIFYSIPFIITNITSSLYTTTDIALLLRGLGSLKYNPNDIDTISSIITTWGPKINTIITSIAIGIVVSLVPTISKSNASGDDSDINDKFNKIIQIFMYIVLPLAIFISIFSKQIWTIFYGSSYYGPIILRFSILVASVDAIYIMVYNALQGISKSRLIYISIICGLGINLMLDIPLMYLFNNLNIYPYYGTIAATLIGYCVSLIISLTTLRKKYNLSYKESFKKLPKLIIIYSLMIFLSIIFSGIISNVNGRFILILYVGIIGILFAIIYYFLTKKELNELFNFNKLINRIKNIKRR